MTDALCSSCGRPLPAGFRFCPSCGSAASMPVEDVRKTVTLLFCDVSGSTALGEQLDPEVLRSLMGQYFSVAREAVARHGGTVEKFVGDAVLAVFGIPVVREDDPLRAVRAGAEMRDALEALAARLEMSHGVRLAVRTGINTGAVVAGGDRAGGSFATGDAVNTAARLEQAAAPGDVLVGESTYRLVRDAVEVEPVTPLLVKGKSEPLVAYRLLRVLDVDDGRARRPEAALVGRERERRVLDEALERVIADSRCHLVTVLGAAGIGKTRLLADFEQSLDGSVQVLRGRCLSYGKGITFWPVVSVLRQAVGLTGTESAEDAKAVLRAALSGTQDADAVVARLAPLMGVEGEPAGAPETTWAVRTLLEHLADTRPVVLVVDDLHWAEPALLDLLEQLRDDVRDVPLLLVCPARPELLEQRPSWSGGAVSATTVLLERLSREETSRLLAGLLGTGVPSEVADAVDRWGDGNPLFLEEVVTHLVEERLLLRTQDAWSLTADLTKVVVPPTVNALLGARLDRLPVGERALLEHASVIGLEATRDEVVFLLGEQDTDALLRSLTRKGLLRRVRTARGEAFAFRHVLVREAAYDAVPKAHRARLHERYADRLTDDGGDAGGEILAFVGHHLEQAARLQRELAPHAPQVAVLEARAAEALDRAGERARHADDAAAASALFERSLAIDPRSPQRRRTLLQLSWAREQMWETTLARAAVDEGLGLQPPGPPDVNHVGLQAQQTMLRLHAGEHLDPDVARELGRRAERAAVAAGDDRVRSHALRLQMDAHWMALEWGSIPALADEVMRIGLPAERLDIWHIRLAVAADGRMPYGQVLTTTAAQDVSHLPPRVRAHLLGVRAAALSALRRPAEAEVELDAAQDIMVAAGIDDEGPSGGFAASVRLAAGDLVAGMPQLMRVIQSHRRSGGLAYASTALGTYAALLAEQGDDAAAAQTVEEAAAWTSPHDALSVALVDCVRAVLAARAGDPDRARRLGEQARRLIAPTELLVVSGDIHRWLAEVPARRGDVEEQRRLLLTARAAYSAKEHLSAVARTESALAALDGG